MNDVLLIVAGCIGIFVALFHGVLMQRLMINPLMSSSYGQQMRIEARRLLPLLLHFTSVFWFMAGVALVLAPFTLDKSERTIVCMISISFYLYGAVGNCWGTRGRHPGWVLLMLSIVLISSSFYLT